MVFTTGLKKNEDFRDVYQNGRSRSHSALVLYVKKNETEENRLGVVVSKKVGNSVIRHRIKRLVKENYRLSETSYKKGYDLVFVARKSAAEADYYRIGRAMSALRSQLDVSQTAGESGEAQ